MGAIWREMATEAEWRDLESVIQDIEDLEARTRLMEYGVFGKIDP